MTTAWARVPMTAARRCHTAVCMAATRPPPRGCCSARLWHGLLRVASSSLRQLRGSATCGSRSTLPPRAHARHTCSCSTLPTPQGSICGSRSGQPCKAHEDVLHAKAVREAVLQLEQRSGWITAHRHLKLAGCHCRGAAATAGRAPSCANVALLRGCLQRARCCGVALNALFRVNTQCAQTQARSARRQTRCSRVACASACCGGCAWVCAHGRVAALATC
jgi:hypothetical protein